MVVVMGLVALDLVAKDLLLLGFFPKETQACTISAMLIFTLVLASVSPRHHQ